MSKIGKVLWGLVFIVVGVIIGANALGVANIDIFFDGWWTFFIIIPCFISLFKEKDKTGNIIGLIIGICLLLGCQDIIAFDLIWKLMFPTILVIIGLSFIFKDSINNRVRKEIKKLNKNSEEEYCATFGGVNLDFSKEEIKSCNLNAIFGGVKCDLRDAVIKEDIVLTTSSIFGGITIYAPQDVNVKVTSTSIFGGVSDERKNKKKDAKRTIYVNATCMFGGVEIK